MKNALRLLKGTYKILVITQLLMFSEFGLSNAICDPLKFDVTDGGHWINETPLIRVLKCDTGYKIKGCPAKVLCLPNGSWSNTTAICESSHTLSAVVLGAAVSFFSFFFLATCVLFIVCLVMKKRRQLRTNSAERHGSDSEIYDVPIKMLPEYYSSNAHENILNASNIKSVEPDIVHTYQNCIELSSYPPSRKFQNI